MNIIVCIKQVPNTTDVKIDPETEKTVKIKDAIARVIAEGKILAYDMLKLKGSPEVLKQGRRRFS